MEVGMTRSVLFLALLLPIVFLGSGLAVAGSPHFVGACTATTTVDATGQTIVTVSGKEAGLGDEAQIHVALTVVAECINNGDNHPKASNKATFGATADEPVQNGQAQYALAVTLAFNPSCSPPMDVVIDSIQLQDVTNRLGCLITQ